MSSTSIRHIVAVALNPAVDRVIEAPNFTIGAHQVVRTLARDAAGKAANVARALATLDVPSTLTGLVGQQEHAFFAHSFESTKVQMRMVPVAGHTRENITLVDPVSRVETHLRDRGFEVTPAELAALKDELARLATPGTVFVFSGSLPPGITPADQAEMIAACRTAGCLVAVDASGPALPAAVQAHPWLIKPNRHELEELLGQPLVTHDALLSAGSHLARSIPLVLVSNGAEGAYLFCTEGTWHSRCTVPAERIISTVGCGDALLAGFLAGLCKRMSKADSLRQAVAAAGATAANLSATFTRSQFEETLPKTEIQTIGS